MASFMQRMIIIVLIFSIAIPMSTCRREKSGRHRHRRHRHRSGKESDWKDDSQPEIDGGNDDDTEIGRYLRDLCSDTKKSKQCWKIIKPEIARFTDTDSKNVAGVVTDLAIAKAGEINDQLSQLYHDSEDDELKDKYISCSKNYNDANRNLIIVRKNLEFDDFGGISAEVNDAADELKSCEHEFGGESFDPAHVRDRNKEFGYYVEIVRTATNRFLRV